MMTANASHSHLRSPRHFQLRCIPSLFTEQLNKFAEFESESAFPSAALGTMHPRHRTHASTHQLCPCAVHAQTPQTISQQSPKEKVTHHSHLMTSNNNEKDLATTALAVVCNYEHEDPKDVEAARTLLFYLEESRRRTQQIEVLTNRISVLRQEMAEEETPAPYSN